LLSAPLHAGHTPADPPSLPLCPRMSPPALRRFVTSSPSASSMSSSLPRTNRQAQMGHVRSTPSKLFSPRSGSDWGTLPSVLQPAPAIPTWPCARAPASGARFLQHTTLAPPTFSNSSDLSSYVLHRYEMKSALSLTCSPHCSVILPRCRRRATLVDHPHPTPQRQRSFNKTEETSMATHEFAAGKPPGREEGREDAAGHSCNAQASGSGELDCGLSGSIGVQCDDERHAVQSARHRDSEVRRQAASMENHRLAGARVLQDRSTVDRHAQKRHETRRRGVHTALDGRDWRGIRRRT